MVMLYVKVTGFAVWRNFLVSGCNLWHCRSNPSRGPWKVTLDRDVYQPFIEYCGHRPTRWNVWQAFNNRASYSQDEMNLSNHKLVDKIRLGRL